MKEKIKARLKAKFSGVNLSKTRLDAIADKLAGKLDENADDAAIDAKLDEMNDFYAFADIAKDDDRLRQAEAKAKNEPAKTGDEPKPKTEPAKTDDMPEWAKSLVESNKALTEKLAAIDAEKAKMTIAQRVSSHEKLKDVPKGYYEEWNMPTKEEEIDAFADRVATKYGEFSKDFTPARSTGFPAPVNGVPGGAGGAKKVDPDVVNFAKAKNDAAVKKAS